MDLAELFNVLNYFSFYYSSISSVVSFIANIPNSGFFKLEEIDIQIAVSILSPVSILNIKNTNLIKIYYKENEKY